MVNCRNSRWLLLLSVRKILYYGILVNLDFDIVVNLEKKGLVLDLSNGTVNSAYSNNLVSL